MRQMGFNKCSECDEAVPVWTRTCGHCGAPNSVLIVAAAGSIYVSTRSLTGEGLGGASIANADGDFAWLVSAMAGCDKLASQQPTKCSDS
jgi:hypothetical protein